MASTAPLQSAGKVDIQELLLISGSGVFVDLHSFLIELNLYEDIYSPGLYGNIVLSDSVGLVHRLAMVGEEYLTIKIDTPSFNSPIWKTFRCSGIEKRMFTRDTTTESYMIHFVSPEIFMDHYLPVQRAFEGTIEDIVAKIYETYIWHPRKMVIKDDTLTDSEDNTNLVIFTECKKPIKFISPSWSPMKCLSWLASKAVSTDPELKAANFMFFETNKQFYWGSLESMIKDQREKQIVTGIYVYAPGNVKNTSTANNRITVGDVTYSNPDITRDFFSIHELTVLKNVDVLQNMQTGYLASVHHELDVTTRKYTETIYDHVTQFPYYHHTQTDARGFFADDTIRSPYAHQMIGFKHQGLFSKTKDSNNRILPTSVIPISLPVGSKFYDSVPDNLNETAKDVMPIRNSLLAEMDQIKLKIDVHGRTDVELGGLIYIIYPKSGPRGEEDIHKGIQDSHYSGFYIITAIHHQISLEGHKMTMEIVKDSFGDVNEGKAS